VHAGDDTGTITMNRTTARLLLRPLTPADALDVHRLAGDRRVAATTATIPHPYKLAMAQQWIRNVVGHPSSNRYSFAITLRDDATFIGVIGLTVEAERAIGNLGYWIGVPYWNNGYATEAATAVIRYGFEELGLSEIQAIHLSRNPASGRVLAKVGMVHFGSSIDVVRGELEPIERYHIARPDGGTTTGLER
jgi:[ribosomal protein S5]-alanine N-acetyltransferase